MKTIDISGQRFGLLAVLSLSNEKNTKGQRLWQCACDCGKTHFATGSHLRLGDVTSCGCMASRKTIGKRRSEIAQDTDPKEYLNARSQVAANGCIEWTGGKTENGYGAAHFMGRYQSAHRLAYTAFNGEIPTGQFVCHSCDNPACVNPAHLWLGKQQDNMTDKVNKSRHCHGETHGMHKLTAEQVQVILKGDLSSSELAERFGVSTDHVGAIRKGLAWKHLQGAPNGA